MAVLLLNQDQAEKASDQPNLRCCVIVVADAQPAPERKVRKDQEEDWL